MNDIDECSEELQEMVSNLISQACEVFAKFYDALREAIEYFSKNLCNSEPWIYIQSWFEACTKNPKSLHYIKHCKKRRIRKKHANCLAKEALKIYEERSKQNDKYVYNCAL